MQEKAPLDPPNDLFPFNFGFMSQFNRTDPRLFCQRWKMTSKLAKIRISQLDGQKRATLLLPKVAIFFYRDASNGREHNLPHPSPTIHVDVFSLTGSCRKLKKIVDCGRVDYGLHDFAETLWRMEKRR